MNVNNASELRAGEEEEEEEGGGARNWSVVTGT